MGKNSGQCYPFLSYVRVLFERFFSPFWHNSNNDNDKDNDSDKYSNYNDYDNDKNNNENSNCGELGSQQTCLTQIGLEISPDVRRTCLAFIPFISTADHYQAGSNTSLRSHCEFFGLLFPFWSVISQAACACSQVQENLDVLVPSCSSFFETFLVLAKTCFTSNHNTRPSWTECDFNFIRTFQSQRAHVRLRLQFEFSLNITLKVNYYFSFS